MVIVIDNYDSFVYNLAQYLGELGWRPAVHRNDEITVAEIESRRPSHIIISPGPCTPLEARVSNNVVHYFAGRIPILGVCLGHQCIAHAFGGVIAAAPVPVHGKSSLVYHDGRTVYRGLPNPLEAGRYHSLVLEPGSCPAVLETPATTSGGVVMGVRHREYVVEGVQFHPESIMTDTGYAVLRNFLSYRQPRWSGNGTDG